MNSTNVMKRVRHETQQPGHINGIGEGASILQRSDSFAQRIHQLFLILLFVLAGLPISNASASDNPRISIEISGHALSAEVAHTQWSRSQGLMYRESLEENTGMLFIFPEANYYSMWMKDTYIPLSVAFIDEQGFILNIEDMRPETRTAHDSEGMAKYALEMNKGWFAARRIAAGARVIGLEKAPAAE